MREINRGTLSNQNLSGFVSVATLSAPTAGTADYKLVIRLTGLNTGHNLTVREVQGSATRDDTGWVFNQAAAQITWENSLSAGDTAIAVSINDATGASSSGVAWTWVLYETSSVDLIDGQTVNATASLTFAGTISGNAFADALLDRTDGIETGWTPRQVWRLESAVLLGDSSNGGDTFRDLNDTKDRVVATVDADNNRVSVTRDAT